MTTQCASRNPVADECMYDLAQCEREVGHEGLHEWTYPGLDGGIRILVRWNEPSPVEFRRNAPIIPSAEFVKWAKVQ